jgi:hypothetical protein
MYKQIPHSQIVPGMKVLVQGFEYLVNDVWGWIATDHPVIRYSATLTTSPRNISLQYTGYRQCTFGGHPDITLTTTGRQA